MKTMPTTKVKSIEPLQWARRVVARHRKSTPDMLMAIWMNPTADPLYSWTNGIELVEISEKELSDTEPEFRALRFGPKWEMPGLILTLTSPIELSIDLERKGKRGFYHKLRNRLESGKALVVFPAMQREHTKALDELVVPLDASAWI